MNNHFDTFGIPESLHLDTAALERRFYELSRKHHPDLQPKPLRPQAEQFTSQLNDAWRTLRDPVKRAKYVLERHHLSLQPTPDILEEMFELNMEREEAETPEQLDNLRARLRDMLAQTDAELDSALQQGLEPVRKVLSKRQYIQNLVTATEHALSN